MSDEVNTHPIQARIIIRRATRDGDSVILDLEINGERGSYVLTPTDTNGFAPAIRDVMNLLVAEGRLQIRED